MNLDKILKRQYTHESFRRKKVSNKEIDIRQKITTTAINKILKIRES